MTQDKTTNERHFRNLEDLNLIDNFLFQQMLSQEDGEEFARILLSTILGQQIRRVKLFPRKTFLEPIQTSMVSAWMLIFKRSGMRKIQMSRI